MSDIAKQVGQQKRAYANEQQGRKLQRKRKAEPGERLERYVDRERGDLRRDAKLAEAGKQGEKD